MTAIDDLAATVQELKASVTFLQKSLYPVDASGLPLPSRVRQGTGQRGMDGPRWQIGNDWTVLALDDPDSSDWVYIRDHYGQTTGDISPMTNAEAIQIAGALLAAVRYSTDELAKQRRKDAS